MYGDDGRIDMSPDEPAEVVVVVELQGGTDEARQGGFDGRGVQKEGPSSVLPDGSTDAVVFELVHGGLASARARICAAEDAEPARLGLVTTVGVPSVSGRSGGVRSASSAIRQARPTVRTRKVRPENGCAWMTMMMMMAMSSNGGRNEYQLATSNT